MHFESMDDRVQSEMRQMELQIEELRHANDKLKAEVVRLTAECHNANKGAERRSKIAHDLAEQLVELRGENEKLKAELQKVQTEFVELEEKIFDSDEYW